MNVGLDFDHGLIERKLNELGRQGWELVSAIRDSQLLVVCVLKKQEDARGGPPRRPVPPKKGRKRKGE